MLIVYLEYFSGKVVQIILKKRTMLPVRSYYTLRFVVVYVLLQGISSEKVQISLAEQQDLINKTSLECAIKLINTTNFTNGTYCDVYWDSLACWPSTPAGKMAIIPCPSYIQGFDPSESAFRYCTDNGTWFVHPVHNTTWSDYTKCYNPNDGHTIEDYPELIAAHLPHISRMYNIGYGLSFASLLLAVVIMLYFRKLRCPRNTIHINLFGSFMLRAAISFLKENLLVRGVGFPSDVRFTEDDRIEFINEGPHVGCKLFFSLFHYILGANYMWILVEALYLHSLITVAVFSESSSIKGFISFGWASPLLFVTPWVIVRATIQSENILCWNTHPTAGYFWIMRGPIVASVVVNFIIFLNVIRVLFTKLNAFNTPEAKRHRYRKLAKSTLVLIPLFGIHYIVFIGLPNKINQTAELVQLYFEMFFNSFQGFFVSLLFCFFNGEVQSEFKKKWKRYRLRKGRSFGQRSTKDTMVSFVTRTRNESAASISGSGDSKDGISNIDDCLKETSCLNGVNRDVYLHGKNKLYNGQNGHVYPCDNSFKDPKVSTAFECEEAKGLLSSDKNRFS